MEFALLVELTIIRQLKLKWVWVSVWPLSAVKPRCKYWYNLRERLIRSLSHIQGFNFPRNKKGKGEEWREDRCRGALGAKASPNLQTISKL